MRLTATGTATRFSTATWSPVKRLVEGLAAGAERASTTGLLLVGSGASMGSGRKPLGAVSLRDNLPGCNGPSPRSVRRRRRRPGMQTRCAPLPPRALRNEELDASVGELQRLIKQDSVRTKQAAGLAVKQFRVLLPVLFGTPMHTSQPAWPVWATRHPPGSRMPKPKPTPCSPSRRTPTTAKINTRSFSRPGRCSGRHHALNSE